jgi:elongator complex protein 4
MIGSTFWNDNTENNLFNFLLHLRHQLRHSLSVCMITVQNCLLNNPTFLAKIQHLSDFVFLIDNSDSVKTRLNKTQYEGLFRIAKLPRLNTLNSFMPETLDLAFYIKRKRLIIEILHLPPDITEDDNEKKGRTTTSSACASVGSSKLDF